jgi:hypothetical protein
MQALAYYAKAEQTDGNVSTSHGGSYRYKTAVMLTKEASYQVRTLLDKMLPWSA